jgi:hypothetical protein
MRDVGTALGRGVAAAALMVSLVACGAAGGNQTAPKASTVSATPPSVPLNSPVATQVSPLTKEAAGRRYLEIVRPYNKALNKLHEDGKRWQNYAVLPAAALGPLKSDARRLADANRQFSIELLETQWPPETEVTVRDLAKEATGQQATIRAMSKARNGEEFDQEWRQLGEGDEGASELLRQQLGLPER